MSITITGLTNKYVDFTSPYAFSTALLAVDKDGDNGSFRGVRYFLTKVAGAVYTPTFCIDTTGATLTLNQYSLSTSKYTSGSSIQGFFSRSAATVGAYEDTVRFYRKDIDETNPNSGVNPAATLFDSAVYDYVLLQKSVSVTYLRNASDNSIIDTAISNFQSVNALTGTTYRFDKTLSRGVDISSVFTILKYDPNSGVAPVTATPGTDYVIVSGSLSSNVLDVQFLTGGVNFRIINTATGYTFSNNPYQVVATDTTQNFDVSTIDLLLTTQTATFSILYPQIIPQITIPAEEQVSTSPITTYQYTPITVQGVLDDSTGYYNQIIGLTTTPIPKTDSEWMAEMLVKCSIVLSITEKSTGNSIQTSNGFGPFNLYLSNINNYIFQYITTLI